MEWIQAFMIGLIGSFHCAGMCGPIALALPLKNTTEWSRVFSSLLYNSGRITTYALLGLIFGLVGKGLYLGGFQQWTSIIAGIIVILSVLFPVLFKNIGIEKGINKGLIIVRQGFKSFLLKRTFLSVIIIGLLNGILPCGLVYLALAGAAVSGMVLNAVIYMVIFGIGTLPIMFMLPLIGSIISLKLRTIVNRVIPWFILIIGILFILRGLSLGIPYISPQIEKHSLKAHCCH